MIPHQYISVAFMRFLHLKTHFQGQMFLFSSVSNPYALYSLHILSHIANYSLWRECTQLGWEYLGSERKKTSLKSLSLLMMSTQRQWGTALISVTCPCASHQLHYGSISHDSPANWIACEVVTMTGARATSVPPLLQKWEWSFPRRCCCS